MSPTFDPMKRESLTYCPFPKYVGQPWKDVIGKDRRYVEWLVAGEGPDLDTDLEEILIELLEAEDEMEDTVDRMYNDYREEQVRDLKRDMFDERNDD